MVTSDYDNVSYRGFHIQKEYDIDAYDRIQVFYTLTIEDDIYVFEAMKNVILYIDNYLENKETT